MAEARILRRNCGDYADFSYVQSDQALVGHVLEAFVGLLPKQCEEECINHVLCKSVNVETSGNKSCELNSKTPADAADQVSLAPRSGWVFKSTKFTERLVSIEYI